jgi:hypothetical protein
MLDFLAVVDFSKAALRPPYLFLHLFFDMLSHIVVNYSS